MYYIQILRFGGNTGSFSQYAGVILSGSVSKGQCMNTDNHRHSRRQEGFWDVYLITESGEETQLGYLFDISDNGINLWVHKTMKNLDPCFKIRIHLPYEVSGDYLDIDLEQVRKSGLGLSPYIEVGCHFTQLGDQKKKIVEELIDYFDKTER